MSLYCTKRRPRKRGSCRRKPTEGEHLVPFCISEPFPFRHGFRRDTNAGWNMVVLLRCRLQYSLFRPILPSLHRPLGVLGPNPPPAGTAFGQRLNHKNERVHKKGAPPRSFFNLIMLFSPSPRRSCPFDTVSIWVWSCTSCGQAPDTAADSRSISTLFQARRRLSAWA